MEYMKIAAGFTYSFIYVLFTLLAFIENPKKKLYDKTIESIMIHEGMTSSQEAMDSFPELKNIKSKLNRISELNTSINDMSSGPKIRKSNSESLLLQNHTHEIRQLRSSIKREVSALLTTYTEYQPLNS